MIKWNKFKSENQTSSLKVIGTLICSIFHDVLLKTTSRSSRGVSPFFSWKALQSFLHMSQYFQSNQQPVQAAGLAHQTVPAPAIRMPVSACTALKSSFSTRSQQWNVMMTLIPCRIRNFKSCLWQHRKISRAEQSFFSENCGLYFRVSGCSESVAQSVRH